ncbi:hypothetical protein GW17_00062285 [Ensete ventricosum]|nr:hypothetical protein GW17_00062285 [Ensete ventricosum]
MRNKRRHAWPEPNGGLGVESNENGYSSEKTAEKEEMGATKGSPGGATAGYNDENTRVLWRMQRGTAHSGISQMARDRCQRLSLGPKGLVFIHAKAYSFLLSSDVNSVPKGIRSPARVHKLVRGSFQEKKGAELGESMRLYALGLARIALLLGDLDWPSNDVRESNYPSTITRELGLVEHCCLGIRLVKHYCSGIELVEHYCSGIGLADHYCSGIELVEHCCSGIELAEHYCSGGGLAEHCCSGIGLAEHHCSRIELDEHYSLGIRLVEHCCLRIELVEHCCLGIELVEQCCFGIEQAEHFYSGIWTSRALLLGD